MERQSEARSVVLTPEQWATIEAYAKDMGELSVSAALRVILNQWKQDRLTQLPLPQPQPCQ